MFADNVSKQGEVVLAKRALVVVECEANILDAL